MFDLLHLDGRDLTRLPLIERKAELASLLERAKDAGPIRYSEHFENDGAAVLQQACKMELEGIVSKRRDAPYRVGRSETFIKTKCSNAQELVVGGYSPSTSMPRAIGALVAGYYRDGKLVYAGRIGTGYTHAVAKDLWKRLQPLERATPPFDEIPREERRRRDVNWVEPVTVIESEFRGWTGEQLVRQAAFKGVREDKPAKEVVREMPMPSTDATESKSKVAAARSSAGAAAKTAPAKTAAAPAKPSAAKSPGGKPSAAKSSDTKPRKDGDVRFTHPDRVYWVDVGVTKQDLADYYRMAWEWMAPHVAGRPLSLVRCPDGTKGQCFFQKHASAGLTDSNLRTVIDTNKRQIIAVDDIDGVLSLVQAGVLEIHVRGSMLERLDLCDRIVFDLDPGDGVTWADLMAAAKDVRERMAALNLETFVKLSGGKGLHVVLPIEGIGWDSAKTFAQTVALVMAADIPDRYVPKMTKSIRTGKIFIDYLRNSLEQTSVAALFDAGAGRRAGLGAGDVAGARPRQGRQSIYRAQSRQAPRRLEAGSVGRDGTGAPEASRRQGATEQVTRRPPGLARNALLSSVLPASGRGAATRRSRGIQSQRIPWREVESPGRSPSPPRPAPNRP